MSTYRIVRMFFEDKYPNRVIRTGLTLEQAQAHCKDPNTSSRTATDQAGVALTQRVGPWFDGYEEEKSKPDFVVEIVGPTRKDGKTNFVLYWLARRPVDDTLANEKAVREGRVPGELYVRAQHYCADLASFLQDKNYVIGSSPSIEFFVPLEGEECRDEVQRRSSNMNRQQYMERTARTSSNEQAFQLHREYYSCLASASGLTFWVFPSPMRERILKSTDPYLNDIPLGAWDQLSARLTSHIRQANKAVNGRNTYSLCEGVCILKEIARQYREDKAQ